MGIPSESPDDSVTQETDSSASDERTISRKGRHWPQLVVMCVPHHEAWFQDPHSDNDVEALVDHFGAERDSQDDFPCQGTVTVVWYWQDAPERRQ